MRPSSGLTFGGRYQLTSRIAIGGMGEVWQASDLVIGRTVALKILKDEYMGDPGFLERFRAEARHAALVNHEGIANVFDYGEEEGSAFLVMELVPGEPLSAILDRERTLSSDRVLDIVAQTAAALHAAHQAGLVHRDIKPGNLLITPEGRVKITDFGIARIADQVPLTATGQVMGTVQYLSPEQASGQQAAPSTDIYSLGIVAYEALAGRRPFTGESQVAIAMSHINDAPPELPGTVPEPVRNLVMSCISKKPTERPTSAAHLSRAATMLRRGDIAGAAAIVPGIASTGSFATIDAPTQAATRVITSQSAPSTATLPSVSGGTAVATEQRKRRPWLWPVIILGVIVLAGVAAILFSIWGQGADPEPTPTETSETPTETPTESAELVDLGDGSDYVGMTEAEFRAAMRELGLSADVQTGDAATADADLGIVYDVNPTGRVQPGATVTATIYGSMAEITDPSAAPATSVAASDIFVGDTVPVSWDVQVCPAGYTLLGYQLQMTSPGAAQQTFDLGTSPTADVGPLLEGSTSVSYSFSCETGDGTTLTSNPSPALAIVAQAPTEPTPTETTPAPTNSVPETPEA